MWETGALARSTGAKHRLRFGYTLPGALNSRAGNVTTAQTSFSTPSTAIPTNLNGSRSSHTIGYMSNANNASGQQITNKMHHRMNVSIGVPFFK